MTSDTFFLKLDDALVRHRSSHCWLLKKIPLTRPVDHFWLLLFSRHLLPLSSGISLLSSDSLLLPQPSLYYCRPKATHPPMDTHVGMRWNILVLYKITLTVMLASTIKVSVVHLLSLLTKQRCHFRGKTESVNGIRSLRHKGLILAFNTLYNTLLLNQLMGTLSPSHKQGDCKAKKACPSVGNPRKCENLSWNSSREGQLKKYAVYLIQNLYR